MDKLNKEERVRVVACLVEGNPFARQRVWLAACSAYQDKVFRNLKLTRIQCDEIWTFIGCKQKNTVTAEHMRKAFGPGTYHYPICNSQ